jgi:hypothetical protein
MDLNEHDPVDEASREFSIVAISTYLLLTNNGLKSDYVIELLHESVDEIINIIKGLDKNGNNIHDE